jgi:hypothetical protein
VPGAIEFKGSAVFSPDGHYRYRLERDFERPGPVHVWGMLNPSTADADRNDPTVSRCTRYSYTWGASRLVVVNLYGYRATDPRALARAADPIGPANDQHIAAAVAEAELVICAWGAHGKRRGQVVGLSLVAAGMRDKLHALALTKTGAPRHPLYLRADLRPRLWRPMAPGADRQGAWADDE